MRTVLATLLLLVSVQARAEGAPPRPTVLELFTSQGCSSCPPADALLTALQADDPGLLALDLHVTYWDRLGWKDAFSLAAVTQRQRQYAARLGLDTVYTPQMVVDGRYQAVGSDPDAVRRAIARARGEAAAVPLTIRADGGGVRIAAAAGAGQGTIVLLGFDRRHTTPIGSGENGGRTLTETNVVRAIAPVAAWTGAALDTVAPRPAGERVAVLLQADDGRILAAATLPPG